ncbi:hypothetical protein WR25_12760 [Diploscapter pachys]|uniref:Uncharacterized protein n=1 Tax=Diploscapter pachys TaxID=2018661 RepID=A0A2A2JVR7_9BILA|nr:hypothetical protein WR25_12760 [Diploscapter pachys]
MLPALLIYRTYNNCTCDDDLISSVPLYTLMIPIVTNYYIKHTNRNRQDSINILVQIKATGEEGASNYAEMLAKQWA